MTDRHASIRLPRHTARMLRALAALGLAATPAALPAQADNPAVPEEVVTLEPMEVTAFQRDYFAPVTDTGLGFAADLYDTPLTVMSIPMDILTDQQVNNVEDALRNVAGVSKFKQGNGGEEKFSIRGFDASQSLYKDGARINNAFNATNIATTETANIERYDVLKGPSAILYGTGEPGGVINYVTKKPRFDRAFASAELIAGSYDYYRSELDLTGPLGASDSPFAYRLVASYEDSDSHRDFHFRERLLLAPSLSWRPTERTTVTLQYEYITDDYTQDRGQVLEGDNLNGYFYSSRQGPEQFFGVPGWNDRTTSDYQRLALLAEHRFADDSRIELAASAARTDKLLYDSGPRAIPASNNTYVAANGDVIIRPGAQGGEGASDTVTTRYHKEIEAGSLGSASLSHKLMAQLDYERIDNDGLSYAVANTADITYNIETGVYTGIPAGGFVLGASSPGVETDLHQYGVVLQDLVSIGRHWHVLLGARYTRVENRADRVSHEDVSPRTGVVYRPRTDLALYASWATGFNPTTATGFNPGTGNGIGGEVLDPETSEQFELGARKTFREGAIELNAAVFELRKENIAGTDPASVGFPADEQWSSNLGETRTLGFEFQAVGRVSASLRFIAGYAYLDNELTEVGADFSAQKGNRLPGIPEHSGNLWGVYEFQDGALRGLGLGLGLFVQGDIFASTENRASYDGFAQLDSLVYYKRDRWKLQVNVKNVTDETYNLAQAGTTSDSFAAVRLGTSTPRTFTASVAVEF
jgi:iron complex outermembrane receptor protein